MSLVSSFYNTNRDLILGEMNRLSIYYETEDIGDFGFNLYVKDSILDEVRILCMKLELGTY